jgi:catechol O-methyltransferase
VLKAIDEFGRTKKYLMNIGEDKGRIVTDLIHEVKPEIMLELGGYCGYSTILFADAQRAAGGKRYYSLERSPKFAKVIETLVEIAGLSDFVGMVVGPSNEGIRILHVAGKVKKIDMMFLDHYKPAYTTDLKLCESLGLIQKSTILAADNVIKPGNPPYLEYVRSSVEEKRKRLLEQGSKDTENFPGRAAKQYGDVEELSMEWKGNPEIVYESRLVNSFEPTGVPVSFLASQDLNYADFELRMGLKSRDVLKCRLEKNLRLLQYGRELNQLDLHTTKTLETSTWHFNGTTVIARSYGLVLDSQARLLIVPFSTIVMTSTMPRAFESSLYLTKNSDTLMPRKLWAMENLRILIASEGYFRFV